MAPVIAVLREDSIMAEARKPIRVLGTDRCLRCNGLMIAEWCDDLPENVGRRCVRCGELIDPVILHNRRLQQTGTFGSGER